MKRYLVIKWVPNIPEYQNYQECDTLEEAQREAAETFAEAYSNKPVHVYELLGSMELTYNKFKE